MKNILLEINMLSDGMEKNKLLQAFYDSKKHINSKNQKALRKVISRLNALYPTMSIKAKEICLMIVDEIKEAEENK